MKQYSNTNFNRKEDIQVQISTARLAFRIALPNPGLDLDDITVRGRLVSPNFGTKTVIERMSLQTLFEIAAKNEGFYRQEFVDAVGLTPGYDVYTGHVDISVGGALLLNNQTYLSLDVAAPDGKSIKSLDVFSIQHAKTTTTYLHYNPVSVTQALQNIQLDKAVEVVLPIDSVGEIQLSYPGNTVTHLNQELRILADMMNDLVVIGVNGLPTIYGYKNLITIPVRDTLSGLEATRLQVESVSANPQFIVYLIEEKTL